MKLPRYEKIQDFVQEAALIGGFLMLLRGLYLIFPPIMWIIGGILLILIGFPLKGGK
jgi:hypothetical protein